MLTFYGRKSHQSQRFWERFKGTQLSRKSVVVYEFFEESAILVTRPTSGIAITFQLLVRFQDINTDKIS